MSEGALDRTATYRVQVDWAPAYELLISLAAFVSRSERKTLDLGTEWIREVRRQLDPALLGRLGNNEDLDALGPMFVLIYRCPCERTAEGFLGWLAATSTGELYELAVPYVPDFRASMLREFDRDRAVELLSGWNEQYFGGIDPGILCGLEAEANARRAQIDSMPNVDLVEAATFGVRFTPEPSPDLVVLTPQFHYRPWNLFETYESAWHILYPADVIRPAAGEPPPTVLRAARVLADASRLRILHFLAQGPATFTEIVTFSGLTKSTVHHHLVALRAAGLIRVHQTTGPKQIGNLKNVTYSFRPTAIDEVGAQLRAYLTQEEPR